MSALSDKIAYLRGLAAGMKISEETDEGRLLKQIIDVLGDVSESIEQLTDDYDELSDYVESIDNDLSSLEDVFEMDDEDDDDGDMFPIFDEDDEDEEETDDFDEMTDEDDAEDEGYEVYAGRLCPECHGMFSVDARDDADQMYICPHCGKRVKALEIASQDLPVAETSEEDE